MALVVIVLVICAVSGVFSTARPHATIGSPSPTPSVGSIATPSEAQTLATTACTDWQSAMNTAATEGYYASIAASTAQRAQAVDPASAAIASLVADITAATGAHAQFDEDFRSGASTDTDVTSENTADYAIQRDCSALGTPITYAFGTGG